MKSKDSVDRMVDGANDLFEARQDPSEQATKLAAINAQGAAEEITPEEDFKVTQYGFELGAKTLTWYRLTYLIPEGVVLMALGDARAFEAPGGSAALYEQALIASHRFLVPWFLRNLLFYLGLVLGKLMPNAWRIATGCMVLWELAFEGVHHLTLNEFFRCYCAKEQESGGSFLLARTQRSLW